MTEHELEQAWEIYEMEMVQCMAEKSALIRLDAEMAEREELQKVRKRIGLS